LTLNESYNIVIIGIKKEPLCSEKMDPIFELILKAPARGSRAVLRDLHGQLKAAILDGRLLPGLRLPATRALAEWLGVSRNTAVAAYELLLSEGYVLAHPGAGSYVSNALPSIPSRIPSQLAPAADHRLNARSRDLSSKRKIVVLPRPRFDFEVGVPDISSIRFDVWNRLSGRSLRMLSKHSVAYGSPEGQISLRAAIAGHVSFARAVTCSAENVVVTNGAQQAFDLLARILVTPGKTVVAVESPGYGPIRAIFAAAGATIVPIRVDEAGLMVERLPDNVRVVCVSPSHQFPLGSVLSSNRRIALLDFARKRNAVVIEDDYDGEFRFCGRPLDALQTLDRNASVFYVGTFSKSLFPALRIGFVVAPPWALRALVSAKQNADRHSNLLAQETLAAFITEGHLARHVRKMRNIYGARRQVLLDGLHNGFGEWLTPVASCVGLHLAAITKPRVDLESLVTRAREVDVGVYSMRSYIDGRSGPFGLLFGYGSINEASIVKGLERLHDLTCKSFASSSKPRR
jgi:GntR family transcriptional regulator / MocR family aminotransferase